MMIEQDLISADLRTHTDPELDEKVEALQLYLRSAKAKLDDVTQYGVDLEFSGTSAIKRVGKKLQEMAE
jgi:hypothetical protein